MKRSLLRKEDDRRLALKIRLIHQQNPSYGYRRIKELLKQEGLIVNHKRLRRVMNTYGLFVKIPRAYRVTTQSRHQHDRYKNELNLKKIRKIDQAWGSDITYIRIRNRFVYLAIVLDLYSRKVVGWSLGPSMNQALTLSALKHAIKERKPVAGCIHHSDQGVQYCSEDYIALLKERRFKISMSRTGNPYDNSRVERFMKTLKYEEIYLNPYESFEEAVTGVSQFIAKYNFKRPHSSLGYLTPAQYESRKRAALRPRQLGVQH